MMHAGDAVTMAPRVALITGALHSGKTTLAQQLAHRLQSAQYRTAGILSLGRWRDSRRCGFDLLDLSTGNTFPLAERHESPGPHDIAFRFVQAGLDAGRSALRPALCRNAHAVFVDEIGKLELAHDGWAPCLAPLLQLPVGLHVWVVRIALLDAVCKKWNIQPLTVTDSAEPDAMDRLWQACMNT